MLKISSKDVASLISENYFLKQSDMVVRLEEKCRIVELESKLNLVNGHILELESKIDFSKAKIDPMSMNVIENNSTIISFYSLRFYLAILRRYKKLPKVVRFFISKSVKYAFNG